MISLFITVRDNYKRILTDIKVGTTGHVELLKNQSEILLDFCMFLYK
jgi:hypothetical protein